VNCVPDFPSHVPQ